MGKVKASKAHRVAGSAQDLYIECRPGGAHEERETLSLSELEAKLGALEESKRQQACALLADLYQFNIDNKGSLDALASKKILMKLNMRLVDHLIDVKVSATLALKNLTECGEKAVLDRVIGFGMLRTAITLAMEAVKAPQPEERELFVAQNLLYVIGNVLDACPAAVKEVTKHPGAFVTFLFSCLGAEAPPLGLCNTIANVLTVVVKTELLRGVTCGDLHALQSLLNRMVLGKISADASGAVAVLGLAAVDADQWVVVLQLLEIVLHCHSRGATSAALQHVLPAAQVLRTLVVVMDAALAHPDLAAAESETALWPLNLADAALEQLSAVAAHLSEQAEIDPALLPCLQALGHAAVQQHVCVALPKIRELFARHAQRDAAGATRVTTVGVKLLVTLEKATAAAGEVLKALRLLSKSDAQVREVFAEGYLAGVMQHLCWLHEAAMAVTSTVDQASKQVVGQQWRGAADGADEGALRVSVLNNAALGLELLDALLGLVSVREEECKELCVQFMRWSQCPHLELVVAVVMAISHFAAAEGFRLPANYHSLLTNAIVNRALNPSAFSADFQGVRSDNVHRSSLLVMDVCSNAVIDMHSSDDAEYLAAFAKMNVGAKLAQVRQDLGGRYDVYRAKLLAEDEREKVEETLMNLDAFLDYKRGCSPP